MRKEENCIILEPGDTLYRYDLGNNLPNDWSAEYSSPEYYSHNYGRKNVIGAFFFFENKQAAKETLAQAIYNQKVKNKEYDCGTITYCNVTNDIKLLDLTTGLFNCSNIISVLYDLDIDVVSNKFYNYQKRLPYSSIGNAVKALSSDDYHIKLNAAKEINEFFLYCPRLLGQSLTDFNNGVDFKKILNEKGFEGYVFNESPTSDTYCLFKADKISNPKHEEIYIESDCKPPVFHVIDF